MSILRIRIGINLLQRNLQTRRYPTSSTIDYAYILGPTESDYNVQRYISLLLLEQYNLSVVFCDESSPLLSHKLQYTSPAAK